MLKAKEEAAGPEGGSGGPGLGNDTMARFVANHARGVAAAEKSNELAERAQVASDRSAKIKELRMLVEMAKAEYDEEENAEEKVELKAKWKARKGALENFLET